MKKMIFCILISSIVILFVSCGTNNDSDLSTGTFENNFETNSNTSSIISESEISSIEKESYSDLEIIAANFCMAYMNHLKNPYSFSVKSIWAYSSASGGYHVYVKFTAENSFGAGTVTEITNAVPLDNSIIETIKERNTSLSIYIKEGQNERNDGTRGEWLEARKIQSYIDENYK